MDSDIEENPQVLRDVTDRLYGGTSDHRLLQELLLGVGGIRAIEDPLSLGHDLVADPVAGNHRDAMAHGAPFTS